MNVRRFLLPIAMLVGLLVGQAAFAQDGWSLAKDAEGIKVYVRNVEGSPLREFRGEVRLKAAADDVVKVLRDANAFRQWMPDVAASELLKATDTEQYHYLDNSAPWPVSNRDGVYHFTYEKAGDGAITVRVEAVLDYLPLRKGKVRIPGPRVNGRWCRMRMAWTSPTRCTPRLVGPFRAGWPTRRWWRRPSGRSRRCEATCGKPTDQAHERRVGQLFGSERFHGYIEGKERWSSAFRCLKRMAWPVTLPFQSHPMFPCGRSDQLHDATGQAHAIHRCHAHVLSRGKIEAIYFIAVTGLLLVIFGVAALKAERGGYAWSVAIPSILFGIVLVGVGAGVGLRTDKQVAAIESGLQESPSMLVQKSCHACKGQCQFSHDLLRPGAGGCLGADPALRGRPGMGARSGFDAGAAGGHWFTDRRIRRATCSALYGSAGSARCRAPSCRSGRGDAGAEPGSIGSFFKTLTGGLQPLPQQPPACYRMKACTNQ